MQTAKLKAVRLAFPALWEPETVNGEGKPAYSGTFLIEPTDPQVKAINAVIEAVAKDKWGAKAGDVLKALRAGDKVCLHNGDLKAQYDGFAGNFFVTARNVLRPLVVDADKTPLTEADGKPYSGCYVNVNIEIWAQDNKFGKRVNANLLGVQFVRDGDRFGGGGRVADVDDFDDVTEGADTSSVF